jgi:hypothetical protein
MIIVCSKTHFLSRCKQRGYDLDQAILCVVEQNGEQWTVDTEHPAYPKKQPYNSNKTINGGPGTELKKILSSVGIHAKPNCACNRKARIMDERGIEWCQKNINQIIGWLKEEAEKRKMPFVEAFARILVKRAIYNAKKKQT